MERNGTSGRTIVEQLDSIKFAVGSREKSVSDTNRRHHFTMADQNNEDSVYNSTVDKPSDVEKEPMQPVATISGTAAGDGVAVTTPKYDEFIVLGRYTWVLCLLGELLILNQLSNMFYMM